MCTVLLYVLLLFKLNVLKVNGQDYEDYTFFETTTTGDLAEGEQRLSDSIRRALEHFKQPNPEGLPGLDVPEPYFVPATTQSLGFGTNLVFTETALYGLSKFRILYINGQINDMECKAALVLDKLQIHGKYSVNMWLKSYKGTFTANVTNIKATALSTLGVERDGKLKAENISVDITFEDIAVNFENAGFVVSLISGVFNSMGTFLFETIKPVLLKDVHRNSREEINKKLDEFVGDIEFPNTISPIDMVIIDTRKKIREMKMDPFEVDDYNMTSNLLKIQLTNTWLTGLSTIYRNGNISLSLENNTLVADFSIGTQELKGCTYWEVNAVAGYISKGGNTCFSVRYIQGRLVLTQSLDTRKRMKLRDLELEVGNIQVGFDGAGTLDYIIEFSANILPTLLRYQIIDAIKTPVKLKIQQELDRVNVEELIINELPKIDEMQAEGFQLAMLRKLNVTDGIYDEDDFFNF